MKDEILDSTIIINPLELIDFLTLAEEKLAETTGPVNIQDLCTITDCDCPACKQVFAPTKGATR